MKILIFLALFSKAEFTKNENELYKQQTLEMKVMIDDCIKNAPGSSFANCYAISKKKLEPKPTSEVKYVNQNSGPSVGEMAAGHMLGRFGAKILGF